MVGGSFAVFCGEELRVGQGTGGESLIIHLISTSSLKKVFVFVFVNVKNTIFAPSFTN